MIRNSFLVLALAGLSFSNLGLAAAPQDAISCKTEQDQIKTAFFAQGKIAQTFSACTRGTLASLEVFADIEFNGGRIDLEISEVQGRSYALKTFTADNYNGTSLVLKDMAIPTTQGQEFVISMKLFGVDHCLLPGTDDPYQFVGALRVDGQSIDANLKLSAGFCGVNTNMEEAAPDRIGASGDGIPSAIARVAAGLDMKVNGDCVSTKDESVGVLNFKGEFSQLFYACDRGRIDQIQLATPYVQPDVTFEYALVRMDNSVITSGTFTSHDVEDGRLTLSLDRNAVHKGQPVLLKIKAPKGARIAALMAPQDADFGKLFVNGQPSQFLLAMAVGIKTVRLAEAVEDADGRDEIQLGAYPVPFAESLSVSIRGIVKAGATLQLLNHQGMSVRMVSLAGGKLDAPVRFTDLNNLRPGLYTLRLVNGDRVISKRILKS
jgi:hypothetical protein